MPPMRPLVAPAPKWLLATGVLSSDDVLLLLEQRGGKPVSRHWLKKLVAMGRVPRPVGRIGTANFWLESQFPPGATP
jgi:hypothetical protein